MKYNRQSNTISFLISESLIDVKPYVCISVGLFIYLVYMVLSTSVQIYQRMVPNYFLYPLLWWSSLFLIYIQNTSVFNLMHLSTFETFYWSKLNWKQPNPGNYSSYNHILCFSFMKALDKMLQKQVIPWHAIFAQLFHISNWKSEICGW